MKNKKLSELRIGVVMTCAGIVFLLLSAAMGAKKDLVGCIVLTVPASAFLNVGLSSLNVARRQRSGDYQGRSRTER